MHAALRRRGVKWHPSTTRKAVTRSERNVVVEVVDVLLRRAGALAACGSARAGRFAPRRRAGATRVEFDVAAAAFAGAADQLHPVADDFRRILLDAVLVGVLARLQSAL